MDAQVKALYDQLEAGVAQFTDSDSWKNYLTFQSKFHRYSFGNGILIWSQCPTASHVAGFHAWKDLGRSVKKGEKAIHILAPMSVKDKETGEYRIIGFKGACVFDVSQTAGAEIPTIANELASASDAGIQLNHLLRQVITLPITDEEMPDGAHGYYSRLDHRIALRTGLAADQAAKTLIHEYAHSILHHKDAEKSSRESKECAAEGTAFVVASYFGLDTSEYSFAYVTSWSDGEKGFVQTVGSDIQKTAARIIGEIEKAQKTESVAA